MSTWKEKVKAYNIFDRIPLRNRSLVVALMTLMNLVIINVFLPGTNTWYWVAGLNVVTLSAFLAYALLHRWKMEHYAFIATGFLFYILLILLATSALYAILRFTAFAQEIDIEEYFRENEERGLLVYFIVNFVQPIFLPTPEAITTMAGSVIFGPGPAFVVGFLGTLSGILFMYSVVRFFGERVIRKFVKEKNLERFYKYIRKQEILFLSIFFIFPIVSDEVVVLGSVLSGIRFRNFLLVAVVAKLITQFVYSYSAVSGIFAGVSGTRFVLLQFIFFFLLVAWRVLRRMGRSGRERHREEGGKED